MATTTVQITIRSEDLTSNELDINTSTNLLKAGLTTGLSETTGVARKTTSAAAAGNIQAVNLYRAQDFTTDGANKIYMKNMSTTVTEYFTIHIDDAEIGRLYAGDWMFIPWNATSGTRASFTVTIASTWAAKDTWEFDGV